MPDTEPKKKAIEYEVPFRQALDDEMKTAKEDGDEDTATIIRRLKVREIKKLADESEKLDLEEAVETQRVRLRNLKTQKKGTSKAPNYVETETGSQNTNAMKELFGPESLKILRDMKEDDRNSLLRSVTMVTQGGTGKGLQSLMPFMFEAQKNVGGGGSTTDIITAADKLLNMYWKGREEKEKELLTLAPSAPPGGTPAPQPKGFLEEILDEDVKNTLRENLKKVLSGKMDPVTAAPQVSSVSDQPIRMVPDPENPGHYFPEIVPNLEEYYKLEKRREEHIKKKTDEEKSVKREDRLFDEVIKPIVKSGTKMIDEEVKKLRGGGAQSSEKSSASEDAKTTSPPQEQSFPCPDTKKCKGTITIKAVNGKWPETATCPTCKQSWKPQE